MERDELEDALRRTGTYDEQAFSRLMLADQPSWRLPISRTLHVLRNLGPFGYDVYGGPPRIDLSIAWGRIEYAIVYARDGEHERSERVDNSTHLEEAIERALAYQKTRR